MLSTFFFVLLYMNTPKSGQETHNPYLIFRIPVFKKFCRSSRPYFWLFAHIKLKNYYQLSSRVPWKLHAWGRTGTCRPDVKGEIQVEAPWELSSQCWAPGTTPLVVVMFVCNTTGAKGLHCSAVPSVYSTCAMKAWEGCKAPEAAMQQ